MELSNLQHRLIERLRDGLPLGKHPYADIANDLGTTEGTVIETLEQLIAHKVINRFGMIIRHRALGYQANAMCVFDIGDGSPSLCHIVLPPGTGCRGLAIQSLLHDPWSRPADSSGTNPPPDCASGTA